MQRTVVDRVSRVEPDEDIVVSKHERVVESSADAKFTLINLIWYIYGFITTVLTIRFVLKIAGANVGNPFVDLVYSVSGVLSAPFDTIFGVTRSDSGQVSSVFEPSILVAIVVYALIAWGISKLLTLNDPQID
jgi:hypothetical protein